MFEQKCTKCGKILRYLENHPLYNLSLCEACLRRLIPVLNEYRIKKKAEIRALIEPRRLDKKYDTTTILNLIACANRSDQRSLLDGNLIKISTLRLKTFQTKGVKCVKCGVVGQYFVLERTDPGLYHLNLYAFENGKEILMTHDHIIPKSKGGLDILSNTQPMCKICNEAKGSNLD